jgi:hypothetical protein
VVSGGGAPMSARPPAPGASSASFSAAATAGLRTRPGVPHVSPLRPEARPAGADPLGILPAIAPAEPMPTYAEPAGARSAAPDRDDDPALPDEARRAAAGAASAPTAAMDAGPDQVLHVTFSPLGTPDRVVGAMEALRAVIRARPGATRVVLHVPAGGGEPLPMELRRGVAYDAELLAEVRRRLGEGLVELRLS